MNGEADPVPMGIMAYQSRTLPWSAQRCINWYAESTPATANPKTPVVLIPRPGLVLFSTITGSCRGRLELGDILYVVFGDTFYAVDSNGATTVIGSISGNGPVSMAASADQITVVFQPDAWVYTISSGAFVQIVDVSFPGSKWVAQLDGYFVHVQADLSGKFFLSNLGEGTLFDALDYATAETDADQLVAAIADHGELWLFGSETIEPWAVTGATDFPMEPIASAKIQRGCIAPNSITRQDNTLFWIGDDKVVYRAAGYTPRRVSTHAIEKILEDSGTDIVNAIGCSYTQDGHSYVQFTLLGQWTIVFDVATSLWHERQTFEFPYWKANYAVGVFNAIVMGGEDGNLYKLTIGTFDDDGTLIRYESTGSVIHASTNKVGMARLQIDMKTGIGITVGQGSDPMIMLSWSDDGGRTWSSEHWLPIGKIGEYSRRAIKRRMGKFYTRIIKLAVTDPVGPSLIGTYADLEKVAA